jgi:hypothetical protein
VSARTLPAAIAAALILGTSADAWRQEAVLRYRWTSGEAVQYRMSQQTTTVVSGLPGGMPDMTVGQTVGQTMRMIADSVAADGTTSLKQTIESMNMNMEMPMGMGSVSYDTAKPDQASGPGAAELKTIFGAMIGQPFTLVVTSRGEVQKVEGFAALTERMFKSMAPDPSTDAIRNGLSGMFSDESMKSMMSTGFGAFPERAAKIGDTWNTSVTVQTPVTGALMTTIGLTLKALEGSGAEQTARIATQITIKQTSKPTGPMPMGLSLEMGEGGGDGEILFSVAKGRMLKSTTRTTTPMKMTGSAPDGTAMNMTTTVKNVVTVELIQP